MKAKQMAERNRWFFWLLSCLIFSAALSYGYVVNSAVVSLVRRGAVEKERSNLASAIGELEARYLREKRGITPAVARTYGFTEVRVARFITEKTVTALRGGAEL